MKRVELYGRVRHAVQIEDGKRRRTRASTEQAHYLFSPPPFESLTRRVPGLAERTSILVMAMLVTFCWQRLHTNEYRSGNHYTPKAPLDGDIVLNYYF
jgi:hypothetical protein